VSYRQIHVYITADGFFQGEYVEDNPRYTRFINKEYYLTKNVKKGGLLENSVWYQEDSYVQALQDAFDRIDKGTYVIRYTFDREDIIKSQQYVQQHGPGNETSQDNLANYITLFQSL
jgi:hypothetical protein